MSRYGNLRSDEKTKIEFKLSELSDRTGKQWAYNVMDKRGEEEITPLLEVIVDGRVSQPVVLPTTEQCPATIICDELESHAERVINPRKGQHHGRFVGEQYETGGVYSDRRA